MVLMWGPMLAQDASLDGSDSCLLWRETEKFGGGVLIQQLGPMWDAARPWAPSQGILPIPSQCPSSGGGIENVFFKFIYLF